ncbi:MAG TPA: CHAD domain-containing protein [Methylovirgula sp.]
MRVRHRATPLRFVLPPEAVDRFAQRLDQHDGIAAMSTASSTIYLDTPGLEFAGAGMSFGIVRDMDRGTRAGWKRFAAPVSDMTPRSAVHGFKRTLRGAADIIVVARVDAQRREWALRFGGCEAEMRLDCASVLLDGKDVTLATVTCASDAPNANFVDFLTSACDADALRLTAESDAQRVYRLGGARASHVLAFVPQLDARMSAAEAFCEIATACLGQFLLNEVAIRATGDREAVHQCRVALRRLSACLRFFSTFTDDADCRALRRDLKKFGTPLRQARDLDVLIGDVIAPALAVDPPPGAEAFMREIEARRARAHADLAAVFDAPATAALLRRFAIWLQTGEWLRSEDSKCAERRSMPIVEYARREFKKLDRKFARRCAILAEVAHEDRHRTRIQAKNMRYDAEFLQSLARDKPGRKRLRGFIEAVKDLQTLLGDWNDVAMARQFLMPFAAKPDATEAGKSARKTKKIVAAKRGASHAGVAEALLQRIEAVSEDQFQERSAQACRALVKLRPFWTRLA